MCSENATSKAPTARGRRFYDVVQFAYSYFKMDAMWDEE